MREMVAYHWPGNVRELENVMERSVLLTPGPIVTSLQLPGNAGKGQSRESTDYLKTMTENERDHILAALEKCDWKVYGIGGAAELLDINPSTLYSRMKKLGLEKRISPGK